MCCCTDFRDPEGHARHVRHACCPTHGRPAETKQSDQVKAAHP